MSELMAILAGAATLIGFVSYALRHFFRGIARMVRFTDLAMGRPADPATGQPRQPGIIESVQALTTGQQSLTRDMSAVRQEVTGLPVGTLSAQMRALTAAIEDIVAWQERHEREGHPDVGTRRATSPPPPPPIDRAGGHGPAGKRRAS